MSHTLPSPALLAELAYRREQLAADVAAARRAGSGIRSWWGRRHAAAAHRGGHGLDLAA